MNNMLDPCLEFSRRSRWLKAYYFFRSGFSVLWVAASMTLGLQSAEIATILLILYPAWDAVVNFIDAQQSGGLSWNKAQAANVVVSAVATFAVVVSLQLGEDFVLAVFGSWAILWGGLQVNAALRFWKGLEAQWAMVMILGGAQSTFVGAFFIWLSQFAAPLITNVAYYASLHAICFFIAAMWMTVSDFRR